MNMLECRVPAYHPSTGSQLPTLPVGILLSASIQGPSMRILVLASTRQSGTRSKCVSSAELGHKFSTQTRRNQRIQIKEERGRRRFQAISGMEGWRLCIPFLKTPNDRKKPFVRIVQIESKTTCLPLCNTVTVESYYMCVFEDFKMEINIFPKSAVIIKMWICLTVRNSELKKFLFLKLNADESYTVQNRNFSPLSINIWSLSYS